MSIFREIEKNDRPKFKSEAGAKRFVGKFFGMKEMQMLSDPDKMPEFAFNIPAQECKAGSHMVDLEGFICHDCYALPDVDENGKRLSNRGGRYKFNVVQEALYRRFEFAMNNSYFIDVMSYLIGKKVKEKFRWFDSGDLQSEKMLDDICRICRNTPHILHWLPTKEWKMAEKYIMSGNKIPRNLDLRLSALKVDGDPPYALAKRLGLNTSTVMSPEVWEKFVATKEKGIRCPSSLNDNKCGTCKACWTDEVVNVGYKGHDLRPKLIQIKHKG